MPDELTEELRRVRDRARKAIGDVVPAGPPESDAESRGLMLASRTDGGRDLPPYYLVYFLLVDLLGYKNLGQWEKVAWIVPVRFRGRLYSIEHRKMGLGIFAPTLDPNARMSGKSSPESEADAREISSLIKRAVSAAEPYFEWRAEQAAVGSELNVVNNSDWLYERYEFLRNQYRSTREEYERRKDERKVERGTSPDGTTFSSTSFPAYELRRHAEWLGQAAIEAFFCWSEHAFIHVAILLGTIRTGEEVASLAEADWKSKFKAALDVGNFETKEHYDKLLDLRAQIRNFMAHGAFGKRGEAFRFHSGAGAVPVLLTGRLKHRYALTGEPAFDEEWAIDEIEGFLAHLWTCKRSPARFHVQSGLPSILSYVGDGTYNKAMRSDEEMQEFVSYLNRQFDDAANMDW